MRENRAPLDTRGQYYDGTVISTPGELSDALSQETGALGTELCWEAPGLRHRTPGRLPRSANDPNHFPEGGGKRLPYVVVHPGRRAERSVPAETGGPIS